jgi:putative tricarboxylic transport membrane protein
MVAMGFEPAPLLLGYVLGPLIEENFRRALLVSNGDLVIFVARPVSAAFLALSLALIAGVAVSALRGRGGGSGPAVSNS